MNRKASLVKGHAGRAKKKNLGCAYKKKGGGPPGGKRGSPRVGDWPPASREQSTRLEEKVA